MIFTVRSFAPTTMAGSASLLHVEPRTSLCHSVAAKIGVHGAAHCAPQPGSEGTAESSCVPNRHFFSEELTAGTLTGESRRRAPGNEFFLSLLQAVPPSCVAGDSWLHLPTGLMKLYAVVLGVSVVSIAGASRKSPTQHLCPDEVLFWTALTEIGSAAVCNMQPDRCASFASCGPSALEHAALLHLNTLYHTFVLRLA